MLNPWLTLAIVVFVLVTVTMLVVARWRGTSSEPEIPRVVVGVWATGLILTGLVWLPWLDAANSAECAENHRQLLEIPFVNELGTSLPGVGTVLALSPAAFQDNSAAMDDVQRTLVVVCESAAVSGVDLALRLPLTTIWVRLTLLLMAIGALVGIINIFASRGPVAFITVVCAAASLLLWCGHLTSFDTFGETGSMGARIVGIIANLRPAMGLWVALIGTILLMLNATLSLSHTAPDLRNYDNF